MSKTKFKWNAPTSGPSPDGYYFYIENNKTNIGNVLEYSVDSETVAGKSVSVSSYNAVGESARSIEVKVLGKPKRPTGLRVFYS